MKQEIITEEQWFNVNQSYNRDPYRSIYFGNVNGNTIFILTFYIFNKIVIDPSYDGSTYIIKSEPRCLRQMCYVKLKYNGTLSNRISGCFSFIL